MNGENGSHGIEHENNRFNSAGTNNVPSQVKVELENTNEPLEKNSVRRSIRISTKQAGASDNVDRSNEAVKNVAVSQANVESKNRNETLDNVSVRRSTRLSTKRAGDKDNADEQLPIEKQ